jgi:hypothetical protein
LNHQGVDSPRFLVKPIAQITAAEQRDNSKLSVIFMQKASSAFAGVCKPRVLRIAPYRKLLFVCQEHTTNDETAADRREQVAAPEPARQNQIPAKAGIHAGRRTSD